MVQPADRIHIFHRNEFAQGFALAGKLAEHAVGLIEKNVTKRHPCRLPEQGHENGSGDGRSQQMEMPRYGTALPSRVLLLAAPMRFILTGSSYDHGHGPGSFHSAAMLRTRRQGEGLCIHALTP